MTTASGPYEAPREAGGECSRCGRFEQHARWCEWRVARCGCGKPAAHVNADPESDEWACLVQGR